MKKFRKNEYYRSSMYLSSYFIQIVDFTKSGKSIRYRNANSKNIENATTYTERIKIDENGNQYFEIKEVWNTHTVEARFDENYTEIA
jgi:hypothetical protein